MKSSKKMTVSEVNGSFVAGDDASHLIHINMGTKRVNVHPPVWAIQALNREATRLGVAEQDLIKIWLIDRLDGLRK